MQVVARGLTKRFHDAIVVDDVSFEVTRGQLLTLLGPSGSGKTTTLMIIAGFVEPDAGVVTVAGRDITRVPANRRGLGVVFQSYALFPHRSVFHNVAFSLHVRGVGRREVAERVRKVLDLVKLWDLRDRGVATLSGGQKQRVALARALVFEPPVLLMDEPLGALDKKLREHMQGEIKAIQEALGITVIYVTHDQSEAMSMSDRIAVMHEGRIMQLGTPAEVYEEPANRFVADFLGGVTLFEVLDAKPDADGITATLAGGLRVPCHRSSGEVEGPAWLGIRPERVRLDATRTGALFEAVVTKRVYLGDAVVYELRAVSGLAVTARVPRDGTGPLYEPGTAVGVRWSARDAWLLT